MPGKANVASPFGRAIRIASVSYYAGVVVESSIVLIKLDELDAHFASGASSPRDDASCC